MFIAQVIGERSGTDIWQTAFWSWNEQQKTLSRRIQKPSR
jgi:hypothetical protein